MNYGEIYSLVVFLEVIKLILAFAYSLEFKLYHMDFKPTFLNGCKNEDVYVSQAPYFVVT